MGYTKAQREAKAKLTAVNNEETSEVKEEVRIESEKPIVAKKRVKKDLPLNTLVPCSNGTYGKLIYVSSRTGETHEWDEYGDTEYLELSELVTMRNSQKRFFTENWIMIDDMDVLQFLGVEKYYEKALNSEEMESLFETDPNELSEKIHGMTDGMKNTVAFYASEKIKDGSLDSRKMISVLENALGVELIEE